MFCRKCGADMPEDSQFCVKCGAGVIAPNSTSASPTGTAVAVAPALEPSVLATPPNESIGMLLGASTPPPSETGQTEVALEPKPERAGASWWARRTTMKLTGKVSWWKSLLVIFATVTVVKVIVLMLLLPGSTPGDGVPPTPAGELHLRPLNSQGVAPITDAEAKKQFDDLYRDSDKLDHDAELAMTLPITNPQQAEMFLIEWKQYHTAELDIWRRRAEIFKQWQKPYPANAIEQEQAEAAANAAYVDVFSYLANPANKFHMRGSMAVIVNPALYSQKKLRLGAAIARLSKVNAEVCSGVAQDVPGCGQ